PRCPPHPRIFVLPLGVRSLGLFWDSPGRSGPFAAAESLKGVAQGSKGEDHMALPSGVWQINVNGAEGDLNISAPSTRGVFDGAVLGMPGRGFWDEVSQTFTFTVLVQIDPVGGQSRTTVALFKGYLFRTPPNAEPGVDILVTLAGSVQVNAGVDPILPPAGGRVFSSLN